MDTFFLLEISFSNSDSAEFTTGPYVERMHALHAAVFLREKIMELPGRYKTVITVTLKEVIWSFNGPSTEIRQELIEVINKE